MPLGLPPPNPAAPPRNTVLIRRTNQVWCVAWSPDGKILASCGGDKTVRLWEERGGRWICEAILEDAHDRTIRALCWSPGGERLATCSFDGTCVIWSTRNGDYEQISTLQGHENEVKSVAFDPSGNLLATCSRDKSVWIWEGVGDEDEYECVAVLHGHSQDVKMVAWHPSKEVLVSASYDDTIRVWEADEDDWTSVQTLDSHSSTVWAVAFDATGSRMASASDDRTVRIWEDAAAAGSTRACFEERASIKGAHARAVYHLDWHPAASALATAGGDDCIKVFQEGKEGVWELSAEVASAHVGDVNCVRWRQDTAGLHPLLASCGDDGVVRLWRVALAD